MRSAQGKIDRHRLTIATGIPPVLAYLAIAALLVAAWIATYAAGGTRTVMPHVFYLPIVLAALVRGPRVGAVAAIVATILCGPLMPLNMATGESQTVLNWAIRGGFFTTVGMTVGSISLWMRRTTDASYKREVAKFVRTMVPVSGTNGDERDWSEQIEQILRERRFHSVFQPMYRFDTGDLFAVEALTRFHSYPLAPPNVWFERAANAGREIELELATIQAAVNTYQTFDIDAPLSLNASPACLLDPRLSDLLTQIPGRHVILEITEHSIVNDYPILLTALATFAPDTTLVAVDDAGSGFASFRHILNLNPAIIKLDVSLVRNITHNPIQYALAESLIEFAHQIRALIVVEGIETMEDLDAWRKLGADAAQGFFLARPETTAPTTQSDRLTTSGTRKGR